MKRTFKSTLAAIIAAMMLTTALPIASSAATVSTSAEKVQTKTMYITNTCYSYKEASTKAEKAEKLKKGAAIKVVDESASFYELSDGSFVQKSKVGEKRINWSLSKYKNPITRYVIKNGTKARESALGNGKVVDTLKVGEKLTIIGKTNSGFYKLSDGSYVKQTSVGKNSPEVKVTIYSKPVTRYVNKVNTKLRETASNSGKVVDTLSVGDKLTVVGVSDNGFYKLEDGGFVKKTSVVENDPIKDTPDQNEDISSQWEYETMFDWAYLTKYIGNDTEVVVPSVIGGYPVLTLQGEPQRSMFDTSTPAFPSTITKVVIPGDIREVIWNTFEGCTNLVDVTIGNGVEYIGSFAFYGCTGLTSINIPDSVISIADTAFLDCVNITVTYKGNTYTYENIEQLYALF